MTSQTDGNGKRTKCCYICTTSCFGMNINWRLTQGVASNVVELFQPSVESFFLGHLAVDGRAGFCAEL